jgi:hypothetical protein
MKNFAKKLAVRKSVISRFATVRPATRGTDTPTTDQTCPMATIVSDRS